MINEETVTIKTAAKIMGKSISSIRYYLHNNLLSGFKPEGKAFRIYLKDVLNLKKWLDNPIHEPTGEINLQRGEVLKIWDGGGNPDLCTSQLYGVSNFGRVFNLTKRTKMTQNPADHGYMQVSLARGHTGDKLFMRVHRMVATMFCDNRKGKLEVHHINGDRHGNSANNLLWVTKKQHGRLDSMLYQIKKDHSDIDLQQKYSRLIDRIRNENYFDVREWQP